MCSECQRNSSGFKVFNLGNFQESDVLGVFAGSASNWGFCYTYTLEALLLEDELKSSQNILKGGLINLAFS